MIDNLKKIKESDLSELLLDASIDRVLAIDREWKVISWNRTSEQVTGISKNNILGKSLLEVFPDLKKDRDFLAALRMAMDGNKSFLLPDPHYKHRSFYENHIIPLEDEAGGLVGIMNLMHDVSHRIKAEQHLQSLNASLKSQYEQLEKANAELAIFLSVTGNDLKEPVKKLYTGLEMLIQKDGNLLSDSSKGGLRRMQASLTKMNLLLDDILSFSSSSSFEEKVEKLELDDILEGVLLSLQTKIAEKKAVVNATSMPSYTGSKEMLHYMFYNIIDNALKFQEKDSIPLITITSEIVDAGKKVYRGTPNDLPLLLISFIDNGIGFAPDDQDRIFKMFERLHSRKQFAGAGIGLTISKKIVEAHGGFIEADSSVGNGSTIRCYLPMRH